MSGAHIHGPNVDRSFGWAFGLKPDRGGNRALYVGSPAGVVTVVVVPDVADLEYGCVNVVVVVRGRDFVVSIARRTQGSEAGFEIPDELGFRPGLNLAGHVGGFSDLVGNPSRRRSEGWARARL